MKVAGCGQSGRWLGRRGTLPPIFCTSGMERSTQGGPSSSALSWIGAMRCGGMSPPQTQDKRDGLGHCLQTSRMRGPDFAVPGGGVCVPETRPEGSSRALWPPRLPVATLKRRTPPSARRTVQHDVRTPPGALRGQSEVAAGVVVVVVVLALETALDPGWDGCPHKGAGSRRHLRPTKRCSVGPRVCV